MDKIIIYQKPTCSTCREVFAALREAGVDFQAVDYYIDPIPREKLKELLSKMRLRASDLQRTYEPVYKELGLEGRIPTDEELLDLMTKHPDLLQRPIVEHGARAILARPASKLKEIIG